MKKSVSTVFGFFAASTVPVIWMSLTNPLSRDFDVASVAGKFFVLYPFSFAATIIIGIPVFLLLRHLNFINFFTVLACGIISGLFVAIVIRMPNGINVNDLFTMIPLAAISALVFWFIWKIGK